MRKARLPELQSQRGAWDHPSVERLKTDVTFCLGMNRGPGQSLKVNGDQRGSSRDEWRR